ncbi:MAG: glycoside hydrolase family 9 protein [bacterium]|nr:glycoside hydrolase family 9 protein [bacterium]
MSLKYTFNFLFIFFFLLNGCGAVVSKEDAWIRVNQIGYLPYDSKIAVLMSRTPIRTTEFKIFQQRKTVYEGLLSNDLGSYLGFPHHYHIDFSNFQSDGVFHIRIGRIRSNEFRIENSLYLPLVDSLLKFFEVQRCGTELSNYHQPCHLTDVPSVIGSSNNPLQLDLTGGWHDAGDYRKFTLTIAHTTYLLLLSYQYFPRVFYDGNSNHRADILDEAMVGLRWLQKAHFQDLQIITQVSDPNDKGTNWRLPEQDSHPRFGYNRPSKVHCAYSSATFALASSVFRQMGEDQIAKEYLSRAQSLFQMCSTNIPNYTSEADSAYVDNTFSDNLALAAVELYRATKNREYFSLAKSILDTLPMITWFSWGDLTVLADARFAEYDSKSAERVENVLNEFLNMSNSNPFGYPLSVYPWGSASVQTGVALLSILYAKATGKRSFLGLASKQRDFILGCNHLGVSFITNSGNEYPKYPHHQIAYLKKISLPAAIMGGFISKSAYAPFQIVRESKDRFAAFQNDTVVYYDDYQDFLTNEPTIGNNAQCLFIMAWWASQ